MKTISEPSLKLLPTGDWISVDPGEVHVGVTFWNGTEPVRCQEFDPNGFADLLRERVGDLEVLVYEKFLLYPGAEQGRNQMGSTFGTCELIGLMRHLARWNDVPLFGYQASHHKALYKNSAYRPPVKKLRDWRSYGQGSHCKDSECLGLYHLRTINLKGKGY